MEKRLPGLDLDALRSFVTGMECGSFAQAALRLSRSTSAVSAQLKKLESQCGTALVTKQGRHLVLTAEGEKLMSYARRLLALNDETLRALQGERLTGEIHLGMQEDFGESLMPGILGQFKRHHPQQKRDSRCRIAPVRCARRWRKRRWIWRCCGKPKIRVPGWASARWRGLRILTWIFALCWSPASRCRW